HDSSRRRPQRTPPKATKAVDASRYEGGGAIVERHRVHQGNRLEIEAPPPNRRRGILALIAALFMIAYFVGLTFFFGDTLSVWWKD
ncbi:MAG: hypothetical protein AAFN74_22585, partial [Myxococcota bacterium]